MRKCKLYALALAIAALGGVTHMPAALAATSITDEFLVTITITSTCSFSTAVADMSFGSHMSTATNVPATSDFAVTCTPGTPYKIELNDGAHFSGTRRMADDVTGTLFVPYGLYKDSAHSESWSTIAASEELSGSGTGAPQALTIYGLVPSANYNAGSYTDTVTATITF